MRLRHSPDESIAGYGPLESSLFRASGMVMQVVVVIIVMVSLVSRM